MRFTLLAVKVTLWGPAPFGGSFHTTLDDSRLGEMLRNGWTVRRTWEVWRDETSGHPFSVDI